MLRINIEMKTHATSSTGEIRLTTPTGDSTNPKDSIVGSIAEWGIKDRPLYCIDRPEIPPGVDLVRNIQKAREMSLVELYKAFKSGGDWDYKRRGREYENFGNWHFGLIMAAIGFDRDFAKRGAGAYQVYRTKTNKPEWGSPWDWNEDSPFGDDPRDQLQIDMGFDAFEKHLFIDIQKDLDAPQFDVKQSSESNQDNIDLRKP